MRIITALNLDSGIPVAYTQPEWEALSQSERDFAAYDEWVWQDQPTKEAAIARHEEAHDAWAGDQEALLPEKETY